MTRARIANRLDRLGLSALLLAQQRGSVSRGLSYHRTAISRAYAAPLDDEVVTPTAEIDVQFARPRRFFAVVRLAKVRVAARNTAALSSRVRLRITSDDGYRDNRDVVLPLVRWHGTAHARDVLRRRAISRRCLKQVPGEPVRVLSYPVGCAIRYPPAVRAVGRQACDELGFPNRCGTNARTGFDPLDVRRSSLEDVRRSSRHSLLGLSTLG